MKKYILGLVLGSSIMKYTLLLTALIIVVIIPSNPPTLEQLSMCITEKSDQIQEEMKVCSEEDYQCMTDVMVKVCK